VTGPAASRAESLPGRLATVAAGCVTAGDQQLVTGFGQALGAVLTESAPDPAWFSREPDGDETVLRVDQTALHGLSSALSAQADAGLLAAAVQVLLDAGVSLQQVDGGAAAADDLVACAADLMPVLEAVGAGLHPLVGLGAQLAAGAATDATTFAPLATRLSALPAPARGAALRDLTALCETLLTEPSTQAAGQGLLAVLTTAARPPAGQEEP
jgi:hypothetical protein